MWKIWQCRWKPRSIHTVHLGGRRLDRGRKATSLVASAGLAPCRYLGGGIGLARGASAAPPPAEQSRGLGALGAEAPGVLAAGGHGARTPPAPAGAPGAARGLPLPGPLRRAAGPPAEGERRRGGRGRASRPSSGRRGRSAADAADEERPAERPRLARRDASGLGVAGAAGRRGRGLASPARGAAAAAEARKRSAGSRATAPTAGDLARLTAEACRQPGQRMHVSVREEKC
mmetsp:Transcript_11052/g.22866  ORF Transcript_11052/g.22866 Transcript_11052/m.22866 type:complete len:231 (-) Transcript_11052:250-942(-)